MGRSSVAGILFVTLLVMLVAGTFADTPVEAEGASRAMVPRTVLGEMFTATWCSPCVNADEGMSRIVDDAGYFPDRFVLIEWHSSDNYTIPEADDRSSMYLVTGIPTVVFDGDGLNADEGSAGSPEDNEARYRDSINARPQSAPVSIDVEATLTPGGDGHIAIEVTVENDLPITMTTVVINAVIVEDDDIVLDTGHHLRMTARDMPVNGKAMAGRDIGQRDSVELDFIAEPEWDIENLGVVAWVQVDTVTNKEVLQAAYIATPPGSMPEGAPQYIGGNINFSMDEDTTTDHIRMDDLFIDPNGDDMNFSVHGSSNLNVQLDKATTVLDITPKKDWFGTEVIQLKATDSKFTTTTGVTVTVDPVQDPPMVVGDLGTITFDEDGTYTTRKGLDTVFYDPDNEPLTYSPTVSASEIGVRLNSDTTLTFVPDADWNGEAELEVKATDGVTWVIYSTDVEVGSVNDPPIIKFASPVDPTVYVDEDDSITFYIEVQDTDDPSGSLEYTWKVDRDVQSSRSQSFTYEPDYDAEGVHAISVKVTDGLAESIRTFDVVVNDVNRPPTVTISSPEENERFTPGGEILFYVDINDPDTGDEDEMEYEWMANDIPIGEGREVFAELHPGNYRIIVTATDGSGDSDTDSIDIVVLDEKADGPVNIPGPGAALGALALITGACISVIRRNRP